MVTVQGTVWTVPSGSFGLVLESITSDPVLPSPEPKPLAGMGGGAEDGGGKLGRVRRGRV